MKHIFLLITLFISYTAVAQCVQNNTLFNFETNIDQWSPTGTYSYGHSGTSYQSSKSIFVKIAFEQGGPDTKAGASTNFNGVNLNASDYEGLLFDFIFVDLAIDPTTVGKPAARPDGNREVYLQLTDQSGKILKYFFTDQNNLWHERSVYWTDFSGDSSFDFSSISSLAFYTDKNGQVYTEVFRFDDIELICKCNQDQMVFDFDTSVQNWTSFGTYSYGSSGISFESTKSVFVKVAFDASNSFESAGASTNFNGVARDWVQFEGIKFDFKYEDLATDNTTIGKPPSRPSGSRIVYLTLTDQSGRHSKYSFSDDNTIWNQRSVTWNDFSTDNNFDRSSISNVSFTVEKNNQEYTEVFRFDDIELICGDGDPNEPYQKLLCTVAKPFDLPKGAPQYSDVCLSSRFRRSPNDGKYGVSTESAIDDFHPSRLDWLYITNQQYIDQVVVPYGMQFSGTLNSNLPDNIGQYNVYNNGRCVDNAGNRIEWPWLDTPSNADQYIGSPNEPAYKQIYLDNARVLYADAGLENLVSVHMDDSGFGTRLAQGYGGCYGQYDLQKANQLGYNVYNYSENVNFQRVSMANFYAEMQNVILTEIGNPDVGFSFNNGTVFNSNLSSQSFDFAMGELELNRANPTDIMAISRTARLEDKIQVFSPVRLETNGPNNYNTNPGLYKYQTTMAQLDLNRKLIATVYAAGGLHLVPWDTWFYDQTRHFGKADEYADLFGMIRAVPYYFDEYEDAAIYSPTNSIPENRYNGDKPIQINAGNNNIWAFARAIPDNKIAPIVIHLVNWGNSATNATVNILNKYINKDLSYTAELIQPKAYNFSAHQIAKNQEAAIRKNIRGSYQYPAYENLVDIQEITVNNIGESNSSLQLNNLGTWSLLILKPDSNCEISYVDISGSIIYDSQTVIDSIKTNGKVISGSQVSYQAGNQIEMVDGFEVMSDALFYAIIDDCTQDGNE